MQNPQLYDNNPGTDIILQGDIFPEIDFFLSNSEVNPDKIRQFQISEKRLISVLSQTCDISDNEFIVVGPVYTIDEYVAKSEQKGENPNKISSNVGYIKSRKGLLDKFYLNYIEITNGVPKECYVDLQQINTVNKNMFPLKNRIASLSHWGRQLLNYQLIWVYGRPVIDW